MDEILSAISTCGFPIVMSLLELYYIITRMDKMTDIINNNTIALKELQKIFEEGGDE